MHSAATVSMTSLTCYICIVITRMHAHVCVHTHTGTHTKHTLIHWLPQFNFLSHNRYTLCVWMCVHVMNACMCTCVTRHMHVCMCLVTHSVTRSRSVRPTCVHVGTHRYILDVLCLHMSVNTDGLTACTQSMAKPWVWTPSLLTQQ